MFGFLKDKLKKAISKFTSDVKEEVEEKVEQKKTETIKEKKPEPKLKDIKEEKKPEIKKEIIHSKETKKTEVPREKKEKSDFREEIHAPKQKQVEIKETIYQKKPEIIIKKREEPEEKKETIKDKEKEHHFHKEEKDHKEKKIEEPKKTGFFGKLKQTLGGKTEATVSKKPEIKEQKAERKEFLEKEKEDYEEEKQEPKDEEKEAHTEEKEKKGFFDRLTEVVTKKTLSESKFEELFFELEIALLENNVAVEVIEKIKEDLKKTLMSDKISRMKTELVVAESLKNSIEELFEVENINLFKEIKKKKPFVICFIGVNGSGKTTNLAKVANYLQKNGFSVVIAACDTFRAAAIQQIEEHANNLGIKLVKHDYGADAAAVAYDAIEHAKAKNKDVVLIDTAGRSHANFNLMEELEKVVRISKPDLKIFVGDSLTGNDAVEQAKTFDEKVGIDGIILSKIDVDEKGGAAISVSFVTKKPIMFIGTGQDYDDLEVFQKSKIIEKLGF